MSHADVITLPQFLGQVPNLLAGLPGLVKGLRLGNPPKKEKTVGVGWCVEEAARKNPNGLAVMYEERSLTYKAFNEWANRIAHYMIEQGIKKGDTVAVMIENRPELMASVTALAKIGAVSALVNTSQRNKVLIHSINLVNAKAAIVGEELRDAYEEVSEHLVVDQDKRYYFADCDTLKDSGETPEGWVNLADVVKTLSNETPSTHGEVRFDDPCFYIYTSGTTGLPKAVVFNHGRFMKAYGAFGFSAVKLKPSDRMYVTLPFYHATAMAVCWGSILAKGSCLIMARKFSASGFWHDIRRYEATAFGYVGELCRYLMDQPERQNDKDNQVRVIVGNGLRPSIWKDFKSRFGVQKVLELYASSEGNIGFTNFLNFDNTVGLSPLPYAIVKYDKENECPIRDKNGRMIKVAKGEVGLLIGEITEKTPFHGYTDPSKTEQCILRDVMKKGDAWFDTGDMMRDLGFKHAQFVDRLGDTFRWKGENVSTTEVEFILDGMPKISETVAYGVEIPNTNGRAGMASIRLDCETHEFDFKALHQRLCSELPAYAIPVFLRISDGVDVTGTFKHKKAPLKEAGFDLQKQDAPVYVWLPGADTYVPLSKGLQEQIESGEYRY